MKFFSLFSLKGFGQFGEERKVGFEPQIWSKDENLIIKKTIRQQNPIVGRIQGSTFPNFFSKSSANPAENWPDF